MSNQDTKKYPSVDAGERRSRARANKNQPRSYRAKRIVLTATIAVLLLILLTALVFIIRDLAKQERGSVGTDPSATSTEDTGKSVNPSGNPELDPVKHPVNNVLDGNDDTYMVSDRNQAVGASLLINLGAETDIMSVEILSNHAEAYLRRADIQTSLNGTDWSLFETFTGSANNANAITLTKGVSVRAAYVRIVLTEKADVQWIVQSVRIISQDDISVSAKSVELCAPTASEVTDPEGTDAPAPAGYQAKTLENSQIYTGDLILVNTAHAYKFPSVNADILPMYDSRPELTVGTKKVMAYKVGGSELPALKVSALKAFNQLAEALVRDTGITEMEIGTNDAWRSQQTQSDLYAKYPTSASPAGFSEHNTGLGVNINLMNDAGGISYLDETINPNGATVYAWLTANAYKFGFVERFPTSKKSLTQVTDNYHYRYVGYAHACYMKQNNLCLEEYIDLLHSYPYNGLHLNFSGDNGKMYEVYYMSVSQSASSTQIYVPTEGTCTVSGDNYSGFIITVEK